MPIQLTVVSLDRDAEELPRVSVFSQDEITLGRDLTNDIILDSPAVAAHHARIRVEDGGLNPALYITDLGSDTGIVVEDEKITPMLEVSLPLNKRFTIGSFLIKPSAQKDQEKKRRRRAILNPAALDLSDESSSDAGGLQLGVIEPMADRASFEASQSLLTVSEASTPFPTANAFTPTSDSAAAIIQLTNLISEQFPTAQAAQPAPVMAEPLPASGTQQNGTSSAEPVAAPPQQIVEIVVDGSNVSNLDFEAIELFKLSGQVLHNGQPLPGARLNAGEVGQRVTSADGRFLYPDILDGTECVLTVELEGFMFNRPQSTIKIDGADVELTIAATKLLTISGRVLHKGQPMEGVEIDGGHLGITHTDAEGVYTFYNVPDGSQYTLTARKGNFLFGTVAAKPQ